MNETVSKLLRLFIAAIVMAVGLILFKLIPMKLWGNNITFDASMHLVIAMFILYVIWFFIDQNEKWRMPFFIFSLVVITLISIQRILVNAHTDVGLLGGIIIGLVAIGVSQLDNIKDKISF